MDVVGRQLLLLMGGLFRGFPVRGTGQQCVEFSGTVQRIKFIAAADVMLADPYLRNSTLTAALYHFGAQCVIARHVYFAINYLPARQQSLGLYAIRADRRGVNDDFGSHVVQERTFFMSAPGADFRRASR